PNLLKHIENINQTFSLPAVVAINTFPQDTAEELAVLKAAVEATGNKIVQSDVWEKGGEGGIELAEEVVKLCDEPSDLTFAYELSDSIEEKVDKIVQSVYGGKGSEWSQKARNTAKRLTKLGYGDL